MTHQQSCRSDYGLLVSKLCLKRHLKFHGELLTVITFELRCFSSIPTFVLILVTSAFFWYLSWARRVRVAPARAVADTRTDRHTHTMSTVTSPPARARLKTGYGGYSRLHVSIRASSRKYTTQLHITTTSQCHAARGNSALLSSRGKCKTKKANTTSAESWVTHQ